MVFIKLNFGFERVDVCGNKALRPPIYGKTPPIFLKKTVKN